MEYVIQAVPKRHWMVTELLEQIPTALVLYDLNRQPVRTFVQSALLTSGRPFVHLEDDVILGENFQERIEAVIAKRPGKVSTFFRGNEASNEGLQPPQYFNWMQCVYFPEGWALDFYEWCVEVNYHPDPESRWEDIDGVVRAYLISKKERFFQAGISFVQHRVARSAINEKRSRVRQSLSFEG